MNREGSYPAPLLWPEKLANKGVRVPNMTLEETDSVVHSYIADGWPGPCMIRFVDEKFSGWMPALTIERAERYAMLD